MPFTGGLEGATPPQDRDAGNDLALSGPYPAPSSLFTGAVVEDRQPSALARGLRP